MVLQSRASLPNRATPRSDTTGRRQPRPMDTVLVDAVLALLPDATVVVEAGGRIVAANRQAETLFGYDPGALVGTAVDLLLPEHLQAGHRRLRAGFLQAPATRTMGSGLALVGRCRDGSEVPIDVSLAPIEESGRLLIVAAIRDISDSQAAQAEVARRERWMAAMADMRLVLLSGQPFADYVSRCIDHIRDITNARAVALAVRHGLHWDQASGTPSVPAPPSFDRQDEPPAVVTVGSDSLFRLVGAGALQIHGELGNLDLPDALTAALATDGSPSTAPAPRGASDAAAPPVLVAAPVAGDRGIDAALLVVVDSLDQRRGIESQAVSFANQVALGWQLTRARSQQSQLLLADDRARIARDLHDHVVQTLFATGMRLQSLISQPGDVQTIQTVATAVDDIDRAITQLRTAVFALRDPSERHGNDEPAGLRPALLALTAGAAGYLGFDPEVRFAGPVELLDSAARPHLLAVAQEALSNVARHAGATTVVVTLRATDDQIHLVVTDNGIGIGQPRRSSGLANMASRARQLGGTVVVTEADGGGTVVDWSVPLTPTSAGT